MANRFWVGGTADWDGTAGTKWSATSGGAGGSSVPGAGDDVFFDANSTGTITIIASVTCRNITCTGFSGTINFEDQFAILFIYGSVVLSSTMTWGGREATIYLLGTGSNTMTFNGCDLQDVYVYFGYTGTGGSWTLQDSINCPDTLFYVDKGTFNTNGYDVVCNSLTTTGTYTNALTLGASEITCTTFIVNSSTTFSGASSTIISLGTFSGGGKTFGILSLGGATNSISGNNTFTTIQTVAGTYPTEISITGTQTLTNFSVSGNSTNRIILYGGHTLAKTNNTDVSVSYLDIYNSTVTPDNTWYANNETNIDGGGNSGWTFPIWTPRAELYEGYNLYSTNITPTDPRYYPYSPAIQPGDKGYFIYAEIWNTPNWTSRT